MGFESLCLCRYDRQKLPGGEFLRRSAAETTRAESGYDRDGQKLIFASSGSLTEDSGNAKASLFFVVWGDEFNGI